MNEMTSRAAPQRVGEPPWLAIARHELGASEAPGPANDARVLAYYRDAGHPEITHDSVAWCAAFACAMLERSGIASPRTLRARDFLHWGVALDAPRHGCIVVLARGAPGSGQGHVGFYVGTIGTHLTLLGGNQDDEVSHAAFPRDRILGFRWPASEANGQAPNGAAAPVSSDVGSSVRVSSDDVFERALAHVLVMEGGWTDDPIDPGGPTNMGITLAEFARWSRIELGPDSASSLKARLRAIDDATVRQIYIANYWQPASCAELPASLALFHFDTAVNQGVRRAVPFLQKALGVEADGEIGPVTLAASTQSDSEAVIDAYAALRREHYRSLSHFWRFGRGWLNRVEATRKAALKLAAQSPTPSQPTAKEPRPMPTFPNNTPPPTPQQDTKWWGHSMTIWGVVITTLTTVLPIAARALGYDLSAQVVQDLGTQLTALVQALGGIAGIVITILGRARATQPLNLDATPPSPPPLRARDWKRE
jgi:uncharacterized protein (TIGR02594 family)